MDARERVRVNTTWTDVDDDRNRWRITSRIILRDDASNWFDHRDTCDTSCLIRLSLEKVAFFVYAWMIFEQWILSRDFLPNLHFTIFIDVDYIPEDYQFNCIIVIWWLQLDENRTLRWFWNKSNLASFLFLRRIKFQYYIMYESRVALAWLR